MKITAYKCDRCGALYENNSTADFTLREAHKTAQTVSQSDYDLCIDCQLKLKSWLREGHAA